MTILDKAAKIVDGERQDFYGHPRDNHGATAELWTTYLHRRGLLADGEELDAHDVCDLNILQKISRDAHSRQLDNLVDIAGFARNAEMIDEPEEEEPSATQPTELPWLRIHSFPPVTRFDTPVSTTPREKITKWTIDTAGASFPLRWEDQLSDIYRAIHKTQLETSRPPEHIFLPEREQDEDKPKPLGPLSLFGIPIEIDEKLDKDEFVVRIYRSSQRIVEFHHYRFGQGPV